MLRQYQRFCQSMKFTPVTVLLTTNSCNKTKSYCTKPNEAQNNKQKRKNKINLPAIRSPFEDSSIKTKESYITMVEIFEQRDVNRRNHVEFIYAALRNMAAFGVEHDLEVYKALINVMPKGKFIPTNFIQAEFQHYPKQQQCMIDLLEQMEDYGVMPDHEMEAMLLNVFGRKGHPLRKYWRMMYWMPKFKNASPWPLPNPVPDDALEIAKLAIERMCTIDVRSKVCIYQTKQIEDAIDDTWIVSGMSEEQSQLLREHPRNKAVYIEGPNIIWLRNRTINYFTLRADPNLELLNNFKNSQQVNTDDVSDIKIPFFGRPTSTSRNLLGKCRSIHQQDDGTIFAICASGTSTKDSLLSWIRLLEKNGNSTIAEIPILFRFTSDVGERNIALEDKTDANAPATNTIEKEKET